MAQALQHGGQDEAVGTQLALYEGFDERGTLRASVTARSGRSNVTNRSENPPLCAGCRAREARYGFRPEGMEVPAFDRPRTLCFDCFRVELTRRQLVRERMARGWNAQQVGLPLEDTLRALDKRRRRAQITARHALGV